MPASTHIRCPICDNACAPLGSVDFNKACSELSGKRLPPSGVAIAYVRCAGCGFAFAPEFADWTLADFENRIYNAGYAEVDPDYVETRPRKNARNLISSLGERGLEIRHLDYGGGDGLLSRLLREAGWRSQSYDPFVDRDLELSELGRFDLITAFEVFEHVPDVRQLISNLSSLLVGNGVIIFSTLVSDGHLAPGRGIDWWYASPRNGHISLFSQQSLDLLAASERLNFASFSDVFHVCWREPVPDWAKRIFGGG